VRQQDAISATLIQGGELKLCASRHPPSSLAGYMKMTRNS